MRARAPLLALALCASCTRASSLPIAEADAARVVVALLDAEGAVEQVRIMAPEAAAPFAARLDAPIPVVSFPIHAEDLLRADGGEVDEAWLSDLRVRRTAVAPEPGAGGCDRCLEPTEGELQVVHAGDSCAPSLRRARIFTSSEGGLERLPREVWGFDDERAVRAAAAQLRLDWPGACAHPRVEPEVSPAPTFEPISPVDSAWPPWTLAQTEDGVLGLFGEGAQSVWWPSEDTLQVSAPLPGRPRVAVPLPDVAERRTRFFVVSSRSAEGRPAQSAYAQFWVEGGALSWAPVRLDGVRDDANFEVHWAGPVPTPEGERLAFAGARAGRPEIALCTPAGLGLDCTSVVFEGAACANVGPIQDLVSTPRGWFAVAPRAYLRAEPSAGGTLRGWCDEPATESLVVWSDMARSVTPRLHSVGAIGDHVYVCAEPELWDAHTIILSAPLGGQAPFDSGRLDFRVRDYFDYSRCGDFGAPLDQLAAPAPNRLRLDLLGGLYDVFGDGRVQGVDGNAYYAQTNLPHTAVHQLAPGWIVHRTGWAVEPRGLGSGILTRSASTDWQLAGGLERSSDFVEVVARDEDLVAFNAFTDAEPFRIVLSDPPYFEAVPQAPGSQLVVDAREAVEAAVYEPGTRQVLLLGNSHAAADGSIQPDNDQVWKPFLRRVSPGLASAVDVPLPLERGQYVCNADWLDEDHLLIVGGQGTLLVYDGRRFERVEIDYDDSLTETVEEAPIFTNSGRPAPHFLSVSAVDGMAWVGGARGLVVRVARERKGAQVRWMARRVSIEREGNDGLRTPLTESTRFTHVQALTPDDAIFAAQRRTRYIFRGCPRQRRERHPTDNSDWVRLGPGDGASDYPIYWQTWTGLPERAQLPELVSGGLVRRGKSLLAIGWEGEAHGTGDPVPLPFYPTAATVAPDGRVVIVGANLRVAVSE